MSATTGSVERRQHRPGEVRFGRESAGKGPWQDSHPRPQQ